MNLIALSNLINYLAKEIQKRRGLWMRQWETHSNEQQGKEEEKNYNVDTWRTRWGASKKMLMGLCINGEIFSMVLIWGNQGIGRLNIDWIILIMHALIETNFKDFF